MNLEKQEIFLLQNEIQNLWENIFSDFFMKLYCVENKDNDTVQREILSKIINQKLLNICSHDYHCDKCQCYATTTNCP
jgi:predicted alternative tryptophan synthase beta-subunit